MLVALDGVDAIVKHYVWLLSRERVDRTDECPRCASRNVRTFFDIAIALDGGYFEAGGDEMRLAGYSDATPEIVPAKKLVGEICTRRLRSLSKLTRDDVCAEIPLD